MPRLQIHEIAYHRNGIGGEPFAVVTFYDPGERLEMVGVLFPVETLRYGYASPRTAVFDRDKLGAGTIAFGENSWRGDNYDPELRRAVLEQYPDFNYAPVEVEEEEESNADA